MANSTLQAIITKVRRLTRSMSTTQISDAEIIEYVNTFIQYDMPEHLRLFNLRQTRTWYVQPNIETYSATDALSGITGLADFDQETLTIHPPIFVAGNKVFFTQSRDQFYNIYTMTNSIKQIALGDGITANFAGTITPVPMLRNYVTITAIDIAGAAMRLSDDGTGILVDPTGVPRGTIDYLTGAYTIIFAVAPGVGQQVWAETVPYVPSTPLSVLYYNNTFTVRPVPDKVYPVNMEVNVRPSELLALGTSPQLEEWWQYIAYGASKKVFEDRKDLESVQEIMAEFKEQEAMIERRTYVQQNNERVATIYTENTVGSFGPGWLSGSGNF